MPENGHNENQAQENLEKTMQADTQEEAGSHYEQLSDLFEDGGHGNGRESLSLELILDIPLNLTVEIGRTEMPIQKLLQLTQGAVIELDKMVGEPMNVLVNGTLIAQGEVVVIDDQFGIRLTQIVSPAERIRHLR